MSISLWASEFLSKIISFSKKNVQSKHYKIDKFVGKLC